MPKEVIRARPDTDDGAGPYIRLGWGKESEHVELGTAVPDGQGRLQLPIREQDGSPGNWETVDSIEDVGWFVQLDRAGINRLIRELRKARDQAFGADA